ncbi:MAG: hypothetical protein BWK79_06505 [Beggiatoa sp. IS2]|nr:MAG: hypothetical protein BWK79_06505 [Beggiatoa sp. IS2]
MIHKNRLIFKIFGSIPLRTLLVVLFVIQIFAAVGLTGYLSFLNGQKAVNDLATQLQNEIAARIQQHLLSYLHTPHLINQSHLNAIHLDLLRLDDPKTLGHYFWHQLQVFTSVSTIYFGNAQGGIVLAGRQVDGSFAIEETKDFVAGDYQIYAVDKQGNRMAQIDTAPYFDSRLRPWYKVALNTDKPVWSEVFFIYARQNLGIAASQPVRDANNHLQGVLTTQLVVSQIGDFLRDLKIGRSGQTFIMERSGLLVASSTVEKPFVIRENAKEAHRLKASESHIPLIRSTANYLAERFQDLHNIDNNQQFIFELEGQRQYLQVSPLRDGLGLDWLIVIAVPEADFMERIRENTNATIMLSLIALAIATVVGILTSGWITQPIYSLTGAAKRLARGEWDEVISVERGDELGVLAHAFNTMVKQLQESFATLATKNNEIHQLNEELEQRVIERTSALNAKIEELVHTRNELLQSEKMASLGRLVAGFAHEINTPIGVAVGAASTLRELVQEIIHMSEQEEVDAEELVSTLESVDEASELTLSNLRRAIRLIGSFKRTAIDQSSEAGRAFDVLETIEDVNNSLHNKFKHTSISIHIDCPIGFTLYGFPGLLDQILTNLMMNSFIHGFNNGTRGGSITIRAALKGNLLRLEYMDTGKGLTSETLGKVFEPFFTTNRANGSSGLGLYICYNLVTNQLHGTISCHSVPGEGVKFNIEYPVQVSQ